MKKGLKKFLKIILVLIVIIAIGLYFFLQSLKPTYEGNLSLIDLKTETTVYYDDYGIPHIYADNEEDALRTLGYVNAQDRLWQMELLRRIAPGRLSEIFGEVALENDKLFIGLGIDEATSDALKLLDKNGTVYKMAMAYLDGVNQFIKEGPTPVEFYLLGIEKEEFTLRDSYNILGYMAFSFATAHKTDPVLSSIQSKLGNEYIKELGLDISVNSTLIHNFQENQHQLSLAINRILEKSPVPAFIGSNSWVISPEKSKSGKVLFANDPHIAFSSPSVWYEAHVKTPNFESYGYYFGGVPFPVLSHNREFAYGLTMFANDDIDFYQETNHASDTTRYKFRNSFRKYNFKEKTIKVKGANDVKLSIRSSQHGPIMNDIVNTIKSNEPISMSWMYTKMPIRLLNAVYQMSRAKNKNDVELAVSQIYAPGLNVMYGDSRDNIAWWAAAQLYKLNNNPSTKLILDGASGDNEIVEYLNFTQNPQAHNPPWNYVYSANNQPDSIANMLYPGYYATEDRAKRIVELIEPKNDWTKEDFMEMINDTKSSVATDFVNIISENLSSNLQKENEIKALAYLNNWDGDFTKASVASTIYTKFTYHFLVNTFEDEIGEEIYSTFINSTLMKRMIGNQLNKNESIWWDNISTTAIEDKQDIIQLAFSETISSLEEQLGNDIKDWTWDRVISVEHKHPIGNMALFRSFFNVGPYKIDGSRSVLNNMGFGLNDRGVYTVGSGPSTRRIVDFSDVENSMSILPTGNSGNPLSEFYNDQADMYHNGEFRKMKMNKAEIESVSTKLIFNPRK